MLSNYETLFGSKPKVFATPMIMKYHPKINTSDLLVALCIKFDQSIIGVLQWLVTLGHFDIHVCVAYLSTYCCAPCQGHLSRPKYLYGYLRCNPSGDARFRVKIPNHEGMATPVQYDWSSSVYGNVTEELPPDHPIPRDKLMCTTTYQYANLFHDLVTGRAMTGVIHFINQTPVI
jgi:hypothetical protein